MDSAAGIMLFPYIFRFRRSVVAMQHETGAAMGRRRLFGRLEGVSAAAGQREMQASVDRQHLARDVSRCRRTEENHGIRDIVRLAAHASAA
jgi:hypothetical protein